MWTPTIAALLRKELLQLRRSRGALLSTTLLPVLLMVLVPLGQLVALRATAQPTDSLADLPLPALAELSNPEQFYIRVMFPFFMALGGLLVPSLAATYTVITERERRTLDLLMALPVRVGDILIAKVAAILLLAATVLLPLFVIDAVVLLALGVAEPSDLALLLLVLLAALACSTGVALLLAVLARDFRTANNLNGALVGPLIVLLLSILIVVPGGWRYVAVVGLLLGGMVLAFVVAWRWLTFERYLA